MDDIAASLARRLEQGRVLSPRDQADPRVEGARSGRKVRFGFWKTNRQSGWYVETNASKKLPLMMVVVRHLWGDKAVIRRGAMIDVELGDEEFDRTWRVEAAPADTARQVLDTELRALLAVRLATGCWTRERRSPQPGWREARPHAPAASD